MAVETRVVTVSECLSVPHPPNGCYQLRNKVVLWAPVNLLHAPLQATLVKLALRVVGRRGRVAAGFPFQPTAGFNFRSARTEADFTWRFCRHDQLVPLYEGATLRVGEMFARS